MTQIAVDTMRTPHIPTSAITNGAFVSPTPLNTPSNMIDIPNIGSDTATMRSTVTPPAMTAGSLVNRPIICAGMAKSTTPATAMTPVAMSVISSDMRLSFFSSPSPSDWPASVEAAACIP